MKTTLRTTALATLLGLATMNAQAGVLTMDGVTFISSWSGNVLTLEIDAAKRNGGWSTATGLAALAIKNVGTYSSVSVSAAPGGTTAWNVSTSELKASGCSGTGNGATSNRMCFFGNQIALGDDMVFKFTFNGAGVTTTEPHVKVEFVDARGNKVGSLLSQTLPATTTALTGTTTAGTGTTAGNVGTAPTGTTTAGTTTAGTTSSTGNSTAGTGATTGTGTPAPSGTTTAGTGTTAGSATTAGTKANTTATADGTPTGGTILPTSAVAETGSVATSQGGTLGSAAPTPLPPAQNLPTTLPVTMANPAQPPGGTAGATGSAVPEPHSIALLLGGLGVMGLALRRRSR